MKQRPRRVSAWRRIASACLVLPLLFALSGPVMAASPAQDDEGRVLMASPARDSAVVATFGGFKTVTEESFLRRLVLPEGLVIRESYIEDGQIIIPPSGLYYTTRTPLTKALQGDKILILGELYYFVDYGIRFDVIKDVDFKLGDCAPIGDGSKCFRLSSISFSFAGQIPSATFQILKPSGNFYGTSFPVVLSDLVFQAPEIADGTENPVGSLQPGEPTDWQNAYYGSKVATSGQTYLVVDEVTASGVHLVDAGTGAIEWMWISATDPVEAVLADGEEMELGAYSVRVSAIDAEAGTVDVEILDGDEVVAAKTFGPIDEDFFNYMPEDPLAREQVTLAYNDEVYVHLDLFREAFPDADSVALVGFTDLIKLENPGIWPDDPRFIARPDT